MREGVVAGEVRGWERQIMFGLVHYASDIVFYQGSVGKSLKGLQLRCVRSSLNFFKNFCSCWVVYRLQETPGQ